MGFQVVGAPEQIETVWCTVTKDDIVYAGQIVRVGNEGVLPLAVAAGKGDETNRTQAIGVLGDGSANNVPFGIVIGTNARTPAYDTTQLAERMTELVNTSATYETYTGVEGPLGQSRDSMVEVAVIYPHTRIRGPLRQAAIGTALTTSTIASGASTLGATTGSLGCTSVAGMATIHFRNGGAAGEYRVVDSASATIHTWDAATLGTPAVGDTCVMANCRSFGHSRMYIDSEAMYVDGSAALTSNYLYVNVLKLDLSEAGGEYVEFNFNPLMFAPTYFVAT